MKYAPIHLEAILYYHSRTDDWRSDDWENAPAVFDTVKELEADGLLRRNEPNVAPVFVPTEKLHAFVNLLCDTPFPIQVWCHPDKVSKEASMVRMSL